MSNTIEFRCTCGANLRAKTSLAGKRARCKKCGEVCTIPEPASAARQSPGGPEFVSALEKKEIAESPLAKTCPECKALIGDLVVCIRCGYHTKLKRKLKVLTEEDTRKNVLISVLVLIPLYSMFPLATYLTLDSFAGPEYLAFFLVGFCCFGAGTMLLRKFMFDHDVFNYLALASLEAAGAIRLANALQDGNFKISFLLLGMIVALLAFLLPRTQNSNEYSESFRSKYGGLSLGPTAALFVLAAIGLGTIYFVPVVSTVVAAGSWFVPAIAGLFSFGTLNPDGMSGFGGRGGSSSYGGCGSSCGGGCGGGGCGGCGG